MPERTVEMVGWLVRPRTLPLTSEPTCLGDIVVDFGGSPQNPPTAGLYPTEVEALRNALDSLRTHEAAAEDALADWSKHFGSQPTEVTASLHGFADRLLSEANDRLRYARTGIAIVKARLIKISDDAN